MAEAITSKGEKVILSLGQNTKENAKEFVIGRDVSEAHPKS